ncbi:hypothetical protein HDU83_002184 [Entophlyctis luteolus]|nr:hypothetical protein HDU83_002184 [Entophlyctis luteolus]
MSQMRAEQAAPLLGSVQRRVGSPSPVRLRQARRTPSLPSFPLGLSTLVRRSNPPNTNPVPLTHRLPAVAVLLLAVLGCAYWVVAGLATAPVDGRIACSTNVRVEQFAAGFDGARAIIAESADTVLVLATGLRQIVRVSKTRRPPLPFAGILPSASVTRTIVLDWTGLELTHAMVLAGGSRFLIASSSNAVYAWEYSPDAILSAEDAITIVDNINGASNGESGHVSRSLAYDEDSGWLYVSIGSVKNVDASSVAARIVRFRILADDGSLTAPEGGFDFVEDGEVWADGIRNSVAMAWDSEGVLWESNNGPDRLSRNDLIPVEFGAADFHNDSPVEEVNLLSEKGSFYGYPFCFTAGNLSSNFDSDSFRGLQYSWTKNGIDGIRDDIWCRNTTNNQPPVAHLPAHSAPISMVFLKSTDGCGKLPNTSFPCDYVGNLVITLHGSWNRDIPCGFSVVMIPFENGMPATALNGQLNTVVTLIEAVDKQNKCKGARADLCFRPTGLAVLSERGTLAVASDATGEVVEVLFQ